MRLILPPKVTGAAFAKMLAECRAIVGADAVFATDEDRDSYRDGYAFATDETHIPSAAVAPANAGQVQEIIRAAGKLGVPVWPISRGKNLTYGGSAPLMSGTLLLDMSRMKKIIEVDPDLGYALVEPGVSFYDLYSYIQRNKLPLWIACPEHAWGSVLGNALERGASRTPYGEHSEAICGLEVVLPDGSLVRTGMGAMTRARTWNLYKDGYGPGWDQMFAQSNFGVVTKLGIWLQPQPQATTGISVKAMRDEDLEPLSEQLIRLFRDGVYDQHLAVISPLMMASVAAPRAAWYDKPGSITKAAIAEIANKIGMGLWNTQIILYGHKSIIGAKEEIILAALRAAGSTLSFDVQHWDDTMPLERSSMSMPGTGMLEFANWYGGRGGHMDFSPVLPSRASLLTEQVRATERLFEEAGHDFFAALHIKPRYTAALNVLTFDRDDAAITDRVKTLFGRLIDTASAKGYGEYRTHLDWTDKVAAAYDFNDNALMRLNERIKDALDPQGILAPGKAGIWPARYRKERAS